MNSTPITPETHTPTDTYPTGTHARFQQNRDRVLARRTIDVASPEQAVATLEAVLGSRRGALRFVLGMVDELRKLDAHDALMTGPDVPLLTEPEQAAV